MPVWGGWRGIGVAGVPEWQSSRMLGSCGGGLEAGLPGMVHNVTFRVVATNRIKFLA